MKALRPKFPIRHPFAEPLPASANERDKVIAQIFWQLVERYRLTPLVRHDEFWIAFAMKLFMDCLGEFPNSKAVVGRPKRREQAMSLEVLTDVHDRACSVVGAHPDWPKSKVSKEVLRQMKRRLGTSARTYRRWIDAAMDSSFAILGAKVAAERRQIEPGTFAAMLVEAYTAFPKRH